MSIFQALTDNEQCILAQVAASQLKNRRCQPLVTYVELSLVKKGA